MGDQEKKLVEESSKIRERIEMQKKMMEDKEKLLKELADKIPLNHPKASFDFKVDEFYRNMKNKLDEDPKVVDYAMEAVRRSNLKPIKNLIRGGTDGARLSYMGVPTPNIFTGGHNFHSKREWISVQDMVKATLTIINLIQIWAEKGDID